MSDRLLKIVFGNSFEVQETPDGWQDITDSITAIKELGAVLETHEGTLTFKEDGYNYLIDKYNTYGWCYEEPCELYQYIDGVYERFCVGVIKLSDIEIDRKNNMIKVKVLDNAFYSKINNNKSVEAYLWAGRSKNDVVITPTPLSDISFFTPSTGVYSAAPAPPYSSKGYRINDVFKYLVDFMTDGTVDYQSSLFGVGGEFEGLSITSGFVISTITDNSGTTEQQFKSNFPSLSFDTVFKEIKKKRDIGFIVDNTGPKPKLIIEYVSDLKQIIGSHSDNTIDELKEIINPNENYSVLHIGASDITDALFTQFPENVSFFAWKDEKFPILGNCNIDRELNLVSDWIIDGGIIEDVFVNNTTDHDEEIVLIDCDSTGIATQSSVDETTTTAPFYYNKAFTNRAVVESYLGGIPNTVAQYFGTSNNIFRASLTTDKSINFTGSFTIGATNRILGAIGFDNDSTAGNYDVNNNYDNVLFEYTTPLAGAFSFMSQVIVSTGPFGSVGSRDIAIYLDVYDNSGCCLNVDRVVSKRLAFVTYSEGPGLTIILSGSATVNLQLGQKAVISLVSTSDTHHYGTVKADSFFQCMEVPDSGFKNVIDPGEYFNVNHQFDTKLTPMQYKTIASDVRKYISFGRYQEKIYFGWIDSLKYKRFTGQAQFTTITTKNNTR